MNHPFSLPSEFGPESTLGNPSSTQAENPETKPDARTEPPATATTGKQPRTIFPTIFAFPPNRDTMGGTAYLLLEPTGNILIDCPAWDEVNREFIEAQGGIRWLFLTHRGGMGKVKEIQQAFQCQILVQEQEAYLLPGLELTVFQHAFQLSPNSEAIWTCGHSPGSACLYHRHYGGILFTGRHLLPNAQGQPVPLRIAKTFHWPRQIQNVENLRQRFTAATLSAICPGANTGFLRGQRAISNAYEQLAQLDLNTCLQAKPGL
ncbi:MAG: MBL fold metallo-hydrolase [Leptolyngbya sp. IPPAS B-1204]